MWLLYDFRPLKQVPGFTGPPGRKLTEWIERHVSANRAEKRQIACYGKWFMFSFYDEI